MGHPQTSTTASTRLLMIIAIIIIINQYNRFIIKGDCVYIYGLVLHNPIPDDLGLTKSSSSLKKPQPQQLSTKSEMINDQNIAYETINGGGSSSDPEPIMFMKSSLKQLRTQPQLPNSDGRMKCRQDSDCINDNDDDAEDDGGRLMYCDQHYGHCNYFHQLGELCRYDSQCDADLICMFGQCEAPIDRGQQGARCKTSADCNEGLCCARQNGEHICKMKLKLGQQCFVPLGGLDYSLNELCPCDDGLECNQMMIQGQNRHKRRRKNENIMRCMPHKSSNRLSSSTKFNSTNNDSS